MHTIIYLTNAADQGKIDTFLGTIRKSHYIKFCSLPPINSKDVQELKDEIEKNESYSEVCIVGEHYFNNKMELFLRTISEQKKKRFLTITLK